MTFHLAMILIFFPGYVALADISGSTTAQRFNGATPLAQTWRVAGAQLGASWTEAFIDFLQFANHMRSLIDGNLFATYGAYREFRQFLEAASDKAAEERGSVFLRKGSGFNLVRLSFEVRSDDDPFGVLSVAYPDSGTVGAGFRKNVAVWAAGRGGRVIIDIDMNRAPAGTYPIVFYAKETDCHVCLSLANAIRVNVEPACGPLPPQCRAAYASRDRTASDMRRLLDNRRALIDAAYRSGTESVHWAINYEKRMWKVCLHQGAPSSPQFERCMSAIPSDLEGFCPRLAFAIRKRDDTCDRLAEIDRTLRRFADEQGANERLIQNLRCCIPGGGGN